MRGRVVPARNCTSAAKASAEKPVITASLPFDRAVEAFELASDRSKAMKVHMTF